MFLMPCWENLTTPQAFFYLSCQTFIHGRKALGGQCIAEDAGQRVCTHDLLSGAFLSTGSLSSAVLQSTDPVLKVMLCSRATWEKEEFSFCYGLNGYS